MLPAIVRLARPHGMSIVHARTIRLFRGTASRSAPHPPIAPVSCAPPRANRDGAMRTYTIRRSTHSNAAAAPSAVPGVRPSAVTHPPKRLPAAHPVAFRPREARRAVFRLRASLTRTIAQTPGRVVRHPTTTHADRAGATTMHAVTSAYRVESRRSSIASSRSATNIARRKPAGNSPRSSRMRHPRLPRMRRAPRCIRAPSARSNAKPWTCSIPRPGLPRPRAAPMAKAANPRGSTTCALPRCSRSASSRYAW